VAHSPGFTFRDEELVRDGDDSFGFVICLSKPFEVVHRRRDFRLSRGEATLMHVCETGRVGSRDDVRYYSIKLQDPHLRARFADPESEVAHRVPRQCEALQLLRGYLGTAERTRLGHSAETRETIGRHVADLVALSLTWHGALGESSFSAVRAARLSAALEFIAAHFDDPALTLAAVSHSQSVSPRYLQRLFEMTGTPFTARVNKLRLERAFALLAAPGDSRLRISDVALQVGFSDISHFNRSFRARFGDTPTAARASRPTPDRAW
jgi:AraC-like DNA-binding protein